MFINQYLEVYILCKEGIYERFLRDDDDDGQYGLELILKAKLQDFTWLSE
jgi:hypothetical protein